MRENENERRHPDEACAAFRVLSEIRMLVARRARGVQRKAAAPTDPAEKIQP